MKRKNVIIIGAVVLVLGGIIFSSAKKNKGPEYETFTVALQDIRDEVPVTGKVKPAEAVDLGFEASGKVADVKVQVSDRVKSGDILATLNSSDVAANLRRSSASVASASADLRQYEAALENEKVKLAELQQGTRDEELHIAEGTVAKAEVALQDARANVAQVKTKTELDMKNVYDDVFDTLQESLTVAQSAFFQDIAPLFRDGTDFDYLSFLTKDSQQKVDIERRRMTLEKTLNQIAVEVANIPGDEAGKESSLAQVKGNMIELRTFLGELVSAVDNNIELTPTDENLYRGYVNTARSNVNAAISSLVAQEQAIVSERSNNVTEIQTSETNVNTAEQALLLARKELLLKQAGPRPEEISAQESRIKQAEATVASARARVAQASADYQSVQANFNKTVLRSPQNGLVTKVDVKRGEFVASSNPIISIISEAKYEVEANIPEVDIAKIALGKTALVTLEAYGDKETFSATVTEVDPAETIVEGIATYKISLVFDTDDERIKSGMTANVKILADQKTQVLAVPLRALLSKDNKKFVRILLPSKEVKEIEVETGLRGENGNIEILQGLNVGDQVIVGEKTKT